MSYNELGNVQCILCKAHVNFTQGGKDTFYKHLKSEHDIFFNQDLVMAVNFLDKDTTQQIVHNFDSQYSLIMKSEDANGEENNEILLKESGEVGDDVIIVLDDEPKAAVEDDFIQIDEESNENSVVSEKSKSKMSFVCSRCNKTCESKETLVAHVKSHEEYKSQKENKVKNDQKKSVSCTDISCDETFYEQSDLIKHTESYHKPIKSFITFNLKEELKNGATRACPICEKVVKNLKIHTEDVHSTGHFPCPRCKKVFTSKNKQSSHTSRNCRKTVDLNKTVPTISKHKRQSRRKSTGSIVMAGEVKLKQIKAQVLVKKVVGKDKIKTSPNLARLSNLSVSKAKLDHVKTEIKTEPRPTKITNLKTVMTTRSRKGKVAMKINKKISKKKLSKKNSTSKRRSGVGTACPICQKVVGSLERHTLDMHSPAGHFPCPGCKKVFTSKNKQSSHTSRNCNPNKPKK